MILGGGCTGYGSSDGVGARNRAFSVWVVVVVVVVVMVIDDRRKEEEEEEKGRGREVVRMRVIARVRGRNI